MHFQCSNFSVHGCNTLLAILLKYKTFIPNFLFYYFVLYLEIIFQIQISKISWACGHNKQKPQLNVLPRKS